jgi:predicted metal-dependent hydrolase
MVITYIRKDVWNLDFKSLVQRTLCLRDNFPRWLSLSRCQRSLEWFDRNFFTRNSKPVAKKTKRKLAHSKLPMQRLLPLQEEGRYFDLRDIFEQLNDRYFRGRLRGYKVMWGRRRKQRPKEYFVFGTIQEDDRVIRINPLLDQPFVPLWFLKYILYHEMLHSVVPDELVGRGRRRVHTDEFNRREREFPAYRRARRWEEENLARFLR